MFSVKASLTSLHGSDCSHPCSLIATCPLPLRTLSFTEHTTLYGNYLLKIHLSASRAETKLFLFKIVRAQQDLAQGRSPRSICWVEPHPCVLEKHLLWAVYRVEQVAVDRGSGWGTCYLSTPFWEDRLGPSIHGNLLPADSHPTAFLTCLPCWSGPQNPLC
jgi:hypothetical protein